jgi:hypothetical protein
MSEPKIIVGKKNLSKTLVDDGTGVEIKFDYRPPTNNERLTYQRKAVKTRGKKIVLKSAAAARELIAPLITGFSFPNPDPDTQIRVEVEDGNLVPLSCDAGDPGYVETWREVLARYVPAMLEILGNKVFAGVAEEGDLVEFEYGDEGGAAEAAAGPH